MVRELRGAIGLLAVVACGGEPELDPDATVVPPETADAAALVRLAEWRQWPTLGDGRYIQAASVDRGTTPPPLLPFPLFSNGNRDFNNFLCAGDGALIGAPIVVDPVLELAACPEPYVRGFVIGRFEGSGVVSRIWMTTFNWRAAPPGAEILRVYVDDAPRPTIQVPLADVVAGTAGEMFAPPFGAGAPDFIATHYPIVFASKLVVAIDQIQPIDVVFHQVDVVLDRVPNERRAAADRLPARDAATATLAAITNGPVAAAIVVPSTSFTIPPAGSQVVARVAGPATIHAVRVRLAEPALAAARDAVVEVRWDDAAPAIALPLASLFGAMRDAPATASLALRANRSGGDVVLELRLPMPFAQTAEWTVRNGGAQALAIAIEIDGEATLPPEPWGNLHAQAHDTVPPAGAAHPLVDVTGRGRLVGVCLALDGHALAAGGVGAAPLNFLEGDERATIDGVLAIEGTGTEDLLDSAFYFEHGLPATAFAQAWGVEGTAVGATTGAASACRWYVGNDAIDFQRSLQMELEIGPGDPSVLDRYRSVAYYYQRVAPP